VEEWGTRPPVEKSGAGTQSPHSTTTALLPTDVVAASSLPTFRRLLNRFLFKQSYPDIIIVIIIILFA